jgi:hypothetical protein
MLDESLDLKASSDEDCGRNVCLNESSLFRSHWWDVEGKGKVVPVLN